MALKDNKEFWREFMAIYRDSPELWKVKSEGYKNRIKKGEAYEKLVKKLKEIDPEANRAQVRSKINILRTSYRRELKKTNNIYHHTLWYFPDLDFLRDQETQMHETPTIESIDVDEEIKETVDDNSFLRQALQQSTPNPRLSLKRNAPAENEGTRLTDVTCQHLPTPSFDSQILAKGWSIEYAKLRPDQQFYAKKFIDDIIFEGRLGNLHRNSIIFNHSTLHHPSPGNHEYPYLSTTNPQPQCSTVSVIQHPCSPSNQNPKQNSKPSSVQYTTIHELFTDD